MHPPPPSRRRTIALTALALLAFAGNSLLCRRALDDTGTDPASFTALRILSGAVVLGLLAHRPGLSWRRGGDMLSAFALFVYAACFSWAWRWRCRGLPGCCCPAWTPRRRCQDR